MNVLISRVYLIWLQSPSIILDVHGRIVVAEENSSRREPHRILSVLNWF